MLFRSHLKTSVVISLRDSGLAVLHEKSSFNARLVRGNSVVKNLKINNLLMISGYTDAKLE